MVFQSKYKISLTSFNLLNLTSFYLIISSIINFTSLFYTKFDDDYFTFLYYGERLLNFNELIWTKEFDDKFPIVQYLFLIPAYFNTHFNLNNTWPFLVLLILIIASIYIFYAVKFLQFNDANIKFKLDRQSISFLCAAIFFYINIYSPSSIFHINAIASSFFAISICALILNKKEINLLLKIVSIILMALSVSIRPFLLPAAILCFFWISIRKKKNYNLVRIFFSNFLFNLFLAFFIIFINFFPFYLTENIDKAIQGFFWLGQNYSHQSLIGLVSHQAETLFVILNKTIFIFCFIYFYFIVDYLLNFKKKITKLNIDIFFLFILAPLSIEALFLMKHFWFHHFVFFSFFISLSIGYFLNLLFMKFKFKITKKISLSIILILLILFFNDLFHIFSKTYSFLNSNYNKLILHEIKYFKKNKKELINSSFNFIYPNNIYIHWSLKESRYGFPHHAMTMQIFNGWFINLKYSNPVYIPSNTKEYCRLLQTNGPEYVITDNLHIEQTRPIIICLEDFNSQYKIHKKINIKTDTEIMIFRKINE